MNWITISLSTCDKSWGTPRVTDGCHDVPDLEGDNGDVKGDMGGSKEDIPPASAGTVLVVAEAKGRADFVTSLNFRWLLISASSSSSAWEDEEDSDDEEDAEEDPAEESSASFFSFTVETDVDVACEVAFDVDVPCDTDDVDDNDRGVFPPILGRAADSEELARRFDLVAAIGDTGGVSKCDEAYKDVSTDSDDIDREAIEDCRCVCCCLPSDVGFSRWRVSWRRILSTSPINFLMPAMESVKVCITSLVSLLNDTLEPGKFA